MLPPGALKPDYTGYCLSNVPSTVMSIFGVSHDRPNLPGDALGNVETSNIENIILLLCDGLGYNQWKKQGDRGFIGRFSRRGNVRPITTVFPSTTAAAITSVSTGMTPQEHGLPEWFVYMDELGEVIVTLPFTRVGDQGRDTLAGELDPRMLFDGPTVFQRLSGEGVRCTSFSSRYLANSAYSRISRTGSDVVPYTSSSDFTVSLRRLVERSRGRNLFYAYWSNVDTLEHVYGPDTDEAEVETSLISHAFEEGFLSKIDQGAAKKTLMLVVADHGQLQVNPEETVYLNRLRGLTKWAARDSSDLPIPPWGSARDCYLRVAEGYVQEAKGISRGN